MIDEGYTKYQCEWRIAPALPHDAIAEMNLWRNRLYDAGLVGYDAEHRVGFGNLSVREADTDRFIVSGTQTGHIARTDASHYARVILCDIDANRVVCKGPVHASSEALTHAAVYALDSAIRAVVHVHDHALWTRLADRLPTTARGIAYGTPEMAREFQRLFRETAFATDGVAIMGGHEDGILSFGSTIGGAALRVLSYRT